ncbi:MAG: 2-oxoacid:ferredoxin oxidoreductase subunit beta [Pseudomonadales bacterium]|nr:2-oxoacid:ferredoxin oxidoreductase subunit beta [Pseudomonadales bacterium]
MSYMSKPQFRHPHTAKNDIGFTRRDYEGSMSTLCAGCGHDSISSAIMQAVFELSIEPHRIVKLSGIGCSSKTPTYFLGKSHGFNSVHGRMPSIATGANLANKDLFYLGVSGDGDSASIGLGQFAHVIRRRLNMLYIIENNGSYGLTKGQSSATADLGSKSKQGETNIYNPIDVVSLAIDLGATFVARSFSGDKEQLVPLIKAGLMHPGFAMIDCLSPCVTFNDHVGSTKSYDYIREHNRAVNKTDFIPMKDEISVSYPEGATEVIRSHDGSELRLQKLDSEYNPVNRVAALEQVVRARHNGTILTGLFYVDTEAKDLHQVFNTSSTPLSQLNENRLCPDSDQLKLINQSLR